VSAKGGGWLCEVEANDDEPNAEGKPRAIQLRRACGIVKEDQRMKLATV